MKLSEVSLKLLENEYYLFFSSSFFSGVIRNHLGPFSFTFIYVSYLVAFSSYLAQVPLTIH